MGNPNCVPSGDPAEVLDRLGLAYSVVTSENTVARDLLVILGIAFLFKVLCIAGVVYKTRRVADIK